MHAGRCRGIAMRRWRGRRVRVIDPGRRGGVVNRLGRRVSYDGAQQEPANGSARVTPTIAVAAMAHCGESHCSHKDQKQNDQ